MTKDPERAARIRRAREWTIRLYRTLHRKLMECKRLHDISKSNPNDANALRAWIDFANENVLVDGLSDSPLCFENEESRFTGYLETKRMLLLRKILLDEDVNAVRQILRSTARGDLDLQLRLTRDMDRRYRETFTVFEIALGFDASLEMVRAIIEEGVIPNENRISAYSETKWNNYSALLVAPFVCDYKWRLQYFDLLRTIGFDFANAYPGICFPNAAKVIWVYTLMAFGVRERSLDGFFEASNLSSEFMSFLNMVSARTIKRIGKRSPLSHVPIEIFQRFKALLFPPSEDTEEPPDRYKDIGSDEEEE